MPGSGPENVRVSGALLIVEDADACSSTLAIALAGLSGLRVDTARNGQEAWDRLQNDREPDVCAVVTDLHMPVLDGYSLIRRIRSDARYAVLPLLVVSGSVDPAAAERAMGLGADAFFEKPYSPARVRAKLEQLLYEKARCLAE